MVDESAEGVSVGKDEVAERTKDKLTFWEAADKYSRSHQKYKEMYYRALRKLDVWCREPTSIDCVAVHLQDVIDILQEMKEQSSEVCHDYMMMKILKEGDEDGVQHSQADEGATGDGGTGHTSRSGEHPQEHCRRYFRGSDGVGFFTQHGQSYHHVGGAQAAGIRHGDQAHGLPVRQDFQVAYEKTH